MCAMVPRVPDEYFRKRAAESEDVREASSATPEGSRPESPVAPEPLRDGIAPRFLVLVLVMALAAAFIAGRLLIFKPQVTPVPETSAPPSVLPSSPDSFAPYDGPVNAIAASAAFGECRGGGESEAVQALIDRDPQTIWRCEGDGRDETVSFTFEKGTLLAGIRLVNGNTVWTGRYGDERRLLSVRWEFADGSFFVQGLSANNANPQEVRFPAVEVSTVTMVVGEATEPGDTTGTHDAVSISMLEFLAPA